MSISNPTLRQSRRQHAEHHEQQQPHFRQIPTPTRFPPISKQTSSIMSIPKPSPSIMSNIIATFRRCRNKPPRIRRIISSTFPAILKPTSSITNPTMPSIMSISCLRFHQPRRQPMSITCKQQRASAPHFTAMAKLKPEHHEHPGLLCSVHRAEPSLKPEFTTLYTSKNDTSSRVEHHRPRCVERRQNPKPLA